ncbi:MAG TPA: S-adenosylmethionine:tRNA ribosyltransferase-isomerase [Acidimicrobiia bacterium]|nr:S-adenosylmethionine:tRNA ribosyltransferase-isomerase [Acidimicrobiia bacterium]
MTAIVREATAPPEARGITRDAVRMMVADKSNLEIVHTYAHDLPRFLDEGDLVVVNTSGTLAAALDALGEDGTPLVVHLSQRLPAEAWLVELRRPDNGSTKPWFDDPPGRELRLVGGGTVALASRLPGSQRLWLATLSLPDPLLTYLTKHGRPIRYGYVTQDWPLDMYQNVYSREPGSAEMPSAGRPFTPELITRLIAKGVDVAPLVLHTGVSSLEANEQPYPEWYRVAPSTAARVNRTHDEGGRVIAIGTTVVRALETVSDKRGVVHPGEGWTDLVVTPERGVHTIDGMLTGWHEPEASHLMMLEAVVGRPVLEVAYAAAEADGYLWHEFGDVNLLL